MSYKFDPVAKVGEHVLLVDQTSYKLYQVAYHEPIPRSHPLVAEVTTGAGLAAGAQVAAFNTTAILDMNEGQLGQFRGYVLDDIHVTILQPQSLARFGLMNVNATINAFSALADPTHSDTEFFIWENQRVFLRTTNPTGYALVQARVGFHGHKLVLAGKGGTVSRGETLAPIETFASIQAARESSYKFAVVPVGGWAQ